MTKRNLYLGYGDYRIDGSIIYETLYAVQGTTVLQAKEAPLSNEFFEGHEWFDSPKTVEWVIQNTEFIGNYEKP